MEIRDFVPGDWEAYLAYSKVFYSGGATLHPVAEENLAATFAECCKGSPLTRGLMVEEGGTPVGYALLSFTWSNEAGGLEVLLEEFYIDPAHRGARLGSRFLDWLFAHYEAARRIRLEVCESNEGAIRLYERSGFEPLQYLQMIRDRK